MESDVVAEAVLALMALCLLAFHASRLRGRLYGARTERLRMRSAAYYAAAGHAVANPDVDLASLDLVSRVARSVGWNGPAWPWVMASWRRPVAAEPLAVSPRLARDLAESSLAGLLYVAEARPAAGWFLRRRLARLARVTDDAGFVEVVRTWSLSAVPVR